LDKLQVAYEFCENVIKENSKTFYRAFSFLPSSQKRAVWAIYAFCRRVDDIIDESAHPKREILQFEQEYALFKKGRFVDDPMWMALTDVFQCFDMDEQAFDDMIKGQKMDLCKNRYDTVEEMVDYSYHVASTVGLMLLPVLAPGKETELREGAIQLGLAMQITNILRDIGEDLMKGRIYLPKEKFIQHHYSMKEFLHYEVNERFISMWEELAKMAEDSYEQAMETVELYPEYSRIPVKGAAFLYRAILDEIRNKGYNVFKQRNFVTDHIKERIMASL
jgi:phytoene synthase